MRILFVVYLLAVLPSLGACRSRHASDGDGTRWTRPKSSPVLAEGAYLRGTYNDSILPLIVRWYVFADGTRVDTREELRTHLRPIETTEQALAYRTLLADVHVEGSQGGLLHKMGSPLTFNPEGRRDRNAEYDAGDAERWGIPAGTVATREGDVFVFRRPHFAFYDDPGPVPPNVVRGWTTKVEHVEERIHRDGRYERIVLKVLEEGDQATAPYQTMPIW